MRQARFDTTRRGAVVAREGGKPMRVVEKRDGQLWLTPFGDATSEPLPPMTRAEFDRSDYLLLVDHV